MKCAAGIFLFLTLVLWSSCRSDFEPVETIGQLEFSRDTVYLDTVFSNLSTPTYSLKVYNRSKEDIVIPEIFLERGENSLYRLNVDGVPGQHFNNIEILARDSIFIFVETTVPAEKTEEKEFLYVDKIKFLSEAHVQEVPLVTLVKDAVFLYPQKNSNGIPANIPVGVDETGEPQMISGFFLKEENLRLTAQKPYVIYGYAAVPEGKTLFIDPGARLHFHANSGIVVLKDAALQVNGKASKDSVRLENEVIFQGDRLQEMYKSLPGQWGTIWLQEGSKTNSLEHVTIRSAEAGIVAEGRVDQLTNLQLKNVQIYNSAASGIWAENAEIIAENLVINNSGQASLHLRSGNYSFTHATLTNYWQQSYRQFPAVYLENVTSSGTAPLLANFYNSIIFGNQKQELLFNAEASAAFNVYFSHSLIKFDTDVQGEFYDFNNKLIYDKVWLNEEPIFVSPKQNDLRLKENSAAINRGDMEVAKQAPLDISGFNRSVTPDLGAHEFTESLN